MKALASAFIFSATVLSIFSLATFADDCPSCIDTNGGACNTWGSGRSFFQWASGKDVGSSITLTAGACDNPESGETGKGYILAVVDTHNATCNGDNPCGDSYSSGNYYAIIEITGNEKAFEYIFPDGITFKGDLPVYPSSGGCYYKSITVDRAGCKYALQMGGGQTHHISLNPTVSRCNGQYDDSQFNIEVKFYQQHDSNYARLARTSGSIMVKRNPKRDFNPLTFKPDLKDGTNIGWIETISRTYEADGDSEWSLNYTSGWSENCESDTAWAAFNNDCGTVIPDNDTFYRIKFPGWEEPVNDLPSYIAAEGWSYNKTGRYIKYDMGDLGAYYFHCDTPYTNEGTSTKYYIRNVEYCTSSQTVGNGTQPWTCAHEYNSPAKLKYIHNGTDPNDPNSISSATACYIYTWGGDGNDPNIVYQTRPDTQTPNWTEQRRWQLEFDARDRAVKFQGGCGSCGGAGDFEHIEYYGNTDLISKRYNANGDIIVENQYGTVDYGEIEPIGWLYVNNYSFESPDITAGTTSNELPTGWDWVDVDDDLNMDIHIYDPNNSSPPDGSQVLRPNGDGIEYTPPAKIYDDTLYLLEAEIKALPDAGTTSTATISLYTTDTLVDADDRLLAQITFTENNNEGVWVHDEDGWDSSEYTEEPINGSFSNNPQFRIEVTGVAVEIDEIRLSASQYFYQTTKNILTQQKTRNDAGSLVMTFQRTIDEDAGTMLEMRYTENGQYRLTKLVYDDDSFANLKERIEYGTISDSAANPTGDTYTTTYTVYDPNGHYTTTAPNGKRADYQRYENGNLVDSYVIDLDNDANSLRQQFTYEEKGNAWRLTEQTNAYGGVTEYDYQIHSYIGVINTYLLQMQTNPNTSAGQQEIEYTYDDAQRVITETRKLDESRNLRTTYDYNATTGFVDSMTVNGATSHNYYNAFGQTIRQINPDGIITGKSYGTGSELVSEFVISENTTDPNGTDSTLTLISQMRYTYTDDGKIEYTGQYKSDTEFSYQNPADITTAANWILTKYEYYANGKKKKVIEDYGTGRTNLTTEYSYNYQGDVEKVLYPTGKCVQTYRGGRGLVTSEETGYGTDNVVVKSAYNYDDNGNLIDQINPDSSSLVYEYDNYDRLKRTYQGSTSDPYTEKFYNTAGDMIREIACEADGTVLSDSRIEYDNLGNVTFERLCFEPNSIDNDKDFTSHYQYDIAGNLRFDIKADLVSSEPNGITTEFRYNNQGRQVVVIDPNGYHYSKYFTDGGLVYKSIDPNDPADPNAFITQNIYDAYGRLEKTIDPMGHYIENTYNSLNQITKQFVYDCNDPNTTTDDFAVRQMRTEYDNLGNITQQAVMADPNESGNVVLGTDLVTDFVFEPNGLLSEQKTYVGASATVARTTFGYDDIGRLILTTDPESNWEKIYYNTTDETLGSQVTKVERHENDPDGANDYTITTFMLYDNDGRLSAQLLDENGDGDIDAADPNTRFAYDGLNRITHTTAPDDVVTFTAYDGFGNVKQTIEDHGTGTEENRKTEFVYNWLNQQVQVKAYDPNDTTSHVAIQTTSYEYNPNGLVTKITYPDNETVEYVYNLLNKVDAETKRDGSEIYYGYWWSGQLWFESDDPDGPDGTPDMLTEFKYNAAGELIYADKVVDNNVEVSRSIFEYNGFGAKTSETARYDDNNISKTTSWTYDGAGNILTQTHGDSVLTYTHDGLGRIKTINKGNDEIVSYDYLGRNTQSIDYSEPNVIQEFGYDELGRITECESTDIDSQPILDFVYSYDSVGNRDTCKYNHLDTPVYDVYEYDSLRRLEKVTYADADGVVALNLEGHQWMMNDLVLMASVWLDGDRLLTADTAENIIHNSKLRIQDSILLSQRTEQMEQILKEAGFRNIDTFLQSAKAVKTVAFNPDEPIYALVEFGDEVPNNYRSETVYNDANDIIAQFIWDNKDRMVLFVMYPGVGGTVVIATTYDNKGQIESKTCMILDDEGTVTHTEDMLLAEQQAALEPDSLSAASMSMDSTAMMSSIPEAPYSGAEQFWYDHLGNRYKSTDTVDGGMIQITTTTDYTHNIANQYETIASYRDVADKSPVSLSHDDNGNLETDRYGYSYSYDYRNRLTEIQDPNSNTVAEYVFDALGRRISKTVGSDTIYFFYDTAGRVLAEYKDGTTPTLEKEYVYGNGINEILGMFNHPELTTDTDDWDEFLGFCAAWLSDPNDTGVWSNSYDLVEDDFIDFRDYAEFADGWEIYPETETRYYYLHDALGSVRGLVGGRYNDPNDYEFYNYDVYGKLSIVSGEESKSGNPVLFAGYRYDSETSLYHTEHRAYDTDTGRWLQMDPIGYADSMSLYEYCISNPTNYIDPWGLDAVKDYYGLTQKIRFLKKKLNNNFNDKCLEALLELVLKGIQRKRGQIKRAWQNKGLNPEDILSEIAGVSAAASKRASMFNKNYNRIEDFLADYDKYPGQMREVSDIMETYKKGIGNPAKQLKRINSILSTVNTAAKDIELLKQKGARGNLLIVAGDIADKAIGLVPIRGVSDLLGFYAESVKVAGNMLNGLSETGAVANWEYIRNVNPQFDVGDNWDFRYSNTESWYGYRWAAYILNNGNHAAAKKAIRACKCKSTIVWRELDNDKDQK